MSATNKPSGDERLTDLLNLLRLLVHSCFEDQRATGLWISLRAGEGKTHAALTCDSDVFQRFHQPSKRLADRVRVVCESFAVSCGEVWTVLRQDGTRDSGQRLPTTPASVELVSGEPDALEHMVDFCGLLIPPPNLRLAVQGRRVSCRAPLRLVDLTLDGLGPCRVTGQVYLPAERQRPTVLVQGIPVGDCAEAVHLNVMSGLDLASAGLHLDELNRVLSGHLQS